MNLTREWSRQLRLPPVFVSLISSLASVKTWIPIFILLYIISYILYRLFVQKYVNYIISLARFDLQDMQCGLVSWKLLGWKSFNKEEKEHILVWTKPKSVLICLIKMSFGFFFFFLHSRQRSTFRTESDIYSEDYEKLRIGAEFCPALSYGSKWILSSSKTSIVCLNGRQTNQLLSWYYALGEHTKIYISALLWENTIASS